MLICLVTLQKWDKGLKVSNLRHQRPGTFSIYGIMQVMSSGVLGMMESWNILVEKALKIIRSIH